MKYIEKRVLLCLFSVFVFTACTPRHNSYGNVGHPVSNNTHASSSNGHGNNSYYAENTGHSSQRYSSGTHDNTYYNEH